jgi:hypothetical protein
MRHLARTTCLATAALALVAALSAHVRLVNSSTGAPLHWASPSAITIVINAAGSADITDGSHFTALRNAIDGWNHVGGTTAHIIEDITPAQEARTDFQSTDIHLMLFDEVNSSGYFPNGSGTVALTPVWFLADGTITDADVLFNGNGFQFTTNQQPARFDVQDVATHELGHFLGLDHSGWAGASLYPYVDPSVILHRSLSRDDVHGARDMYPAQGFASIHGTIRRNADNTIVAGAHVVARDANGRTTGGTLSDASGNFTLVGLDAGTYTVYATPLDFPVSAANLIAGHTIQTDFESTVLGTFALSAGQAAAVGDLLVMPDVAIGLGKNSDPFPLRCTAGTTRSFALHGSGLLTGSTLTVSDPTLTVVATGWFTTQVTFQVTTPAGSTFGHVDLAVTNPSGDSSILPAALEITPRDPSVLSVTPSSGPKSGGTPLTIGGANFQTGARVVIGGNIYVEGDAHGTTVVDANTITLTTAPTSAGAHDVVVIDSTGVEGRAANGFTASLNPIVASVFPAAGSASGGTTVVLRGQDFATNALVSIDGVQQTQVTVTDATRIVLVTDAGVVGGPYVLQVDNQDGTSATSAFSYAASPDPVITAVAPASGKSSGNENVVVHGANFTSTTGVIFGADADTGVGGAASPLVTFVDATTLAIKSPAHAAGTVNVITFDSASGQAAVAPNAFAFAAPKGGGGCSVAPLARPRSPLDALADGAWLLALLAILHARSRAASRRAAVAVRAR